MRLRAAMKGLRPLTTSVEPCPGPPKAYLAGVGGRREEILVPAGLLRWRGPYIPGGRTAPSTWQISGEGPAQLVWALKGTVEDEEAM